MRLQKIIWDSAVLQGACPASLFFRGEASVNQAAWLMIPEGGEVSFDTYFNWFAVRKWKTYTTVQKLSVYLELRGKGHISLMGMDKEWGYEERSLYEKDYHCADFEVVEVGKNIVLAQMPDFCFLRVKALEETAVRDGGWYSADGERAGHEVGTGGAAVSGTAEGVPEPDECAVSGAAEGVSGPDKCAVSGTAEGVSEPDGCAVSGAAERMLESDECTVSGAVKGTSGMDGGSGRNPADVAGRTDGLGEKDLEGEIRIACCICTFRREAFVKRNVEMMIRELMDNPKSALYGRMEIYIADNGRTLPADFFHYHPCVHILPNPNYGGSAGFTRNMIEAVLYRTGASFSHLILMDDDILLLPEVLERTYVLLGVMKAAYRTCVLGGAMLLLEEPDIQAEACGHYELLTGSNRHSPRERMNLSVRENLILNESEEDANFSGWWYSCIPAETIREDNLPLPLFIHRDDQEYGLRMGKPVIQMGGICIWHPSPAGKHAEYILYYDMRNMLIAAMNHYPDRLSGRALKRLLAVKTIQYCLGYRYSGALMCLRGCEDFCRGYGWFLNMDPEQLHQELLEQTKFQWVPVTEEEMRAGCVKKPEEERHIGAAAKIWRYLFPSAKICYAEAGCNYPSYLGYRKVVCLNAERNQGYRLSMSWKMTFRVMGKLLKVCRRIDSEYDRACREWEEGVDALQSLEFWKRYLKI